MQQRYYDPIAGRFLSVDPIVTDANTGAGFGRYAYAENSPYVYIDPDGRESVGCELGQCTTPSPPPQVPIILPPILPIGVPVTPIVTPLPLIQLPPVFISGQSAGRSPIHTPLELWSAANVLIKVAAERWTNNAIFNKPSDGKGEFWKGLQPYRGKTKTNGLSGGKRRFYEWDHTHGDVEQYDSRGRHLGSVDGETGEQTKDAVPGRKIDL